MFRLSSILLISMVSVFFAGEISVAQDATPQVPAHFQKYVHAKLGFSILYPSNIAWQLDSLGNGISLETPERDFKCGVDVATLPPEQNLEGFYQDLMLKVLPAIFDSSEITSAKITANIQTTDVMLDGVKGKCVFLKAIEIPISRELTAKLGLPMRYNVYYKVSAKLYLVVKQGKGFMLGGLGPAESFGKYENGLDIMVQSFQLEKPDIKQLQAERELSRTPAANEAATIASLRSMAASQGQFQGNVIVDQDEDGEGEFGFLQELAGTALPRGKTSPVYPPFLAKSFGVTRNGVVTKNGYHFYIYLPGKDGAMGERDGNAPTDRGSANLQEKYWVCYAWPVEYQKTGTQVFAVNQGGTVIAATNTDGKYSGLTKKPLWNAAFVKNPTEAQFFQFTIELGLQPNKSGDGLSWISTKD